MNIHSQELDELDVLSDDVCQRVVKCRDRIGGGDLLARIACTTTAGNSDSLQKQFSLHNVLRDSGIVDACDLIVQNKQVVGFTMPILEGQPLSVGAATLTPPQLFRVLQDICWAVFSLHSHGFIHCDLTPNNIWVSMQDGVASATLLDLGFATPIGTRSETVVRGTHGYVAPELSRGAPLRPAQDAYAFGKVIEHCAFHVKCELVRNSLHALAQSCTLDDLEKRLEDFSKIYFAIRRVANDCLEEGIPHSRLSLSLRPTGLELRARSLRRQLSVGMCWCGGPRGTGKSSVLRTLCRQMQMEGETTIRLTGVGDVDELVAGLDFIFSKGADSRVRRVFVKTRPTLAMRSHDRLTINKIAAAHAATIIVESPQEAADSKPRDATAWVPQPLSVRECIRATSHLLMPETSIEAHAEAIYAMTMGNPRAMNNVMSDYFRSGRRGRGEPPDFARHHHSHAGGPECDTAQNAPPVDHLRDHRVLLGNQLANIRSGRRVGHRPPLGTFRFISDRYSVLGSFRRRSRWAQRGVQAASELGEYPADESELSDLIGLLDLAPSSGVKLGCLRTILARGNHLSRASLGMIKSEIGAALLHASKPAEARDVLYEALALHNQHSDCVQREGVVLNRLGTAKLISRDLAPARQYFTRALTCAQEAQDGLTTSRIIGNLGLHAYYSAEPSTALDYFSRHRKLTRAGHKYSEYLTTLLNETSCFVDLGRGAAAERRARLAVSMAELLADEMRLGYAYNNLGWILTMRCQGGPAKEWLARALRIRDHIGDSRGRAASLLNLARLYLLARDYEHARAQLREAQSQFEKLQDDEGQWDCYRLSARMAIAREQYREAEALLAAIPREAHRQSERDAADIELLRLQIALWLGEDDRARSCLAIIDSLPAVSRVHPLLTRRTLLTSVMSLREGDLDTALSLAASATGAFRQSGRDDLLLEGLMIMSILAGRMGNPRLGLTYIRNLVEITDRLKAEVE